MLMKNEEKVKNLYEKGFSVGEISKDLAMQAPNVSMYLNKIYGKDRIKGLHYKVINKKYKINENYFETIDSEEKSYFLGLLYADGCISKTQNCIQIALQAEDKYILELFSKSIETNKPLRFIKGSVVKGFKENKKVCFRKDQYLMYMHSPKIKKDLINLGCVPNKSLILTFPDKISEKLIFHFIRGYFDGDGNLYEGVKNRWGISIAGSEIFCKELCTVLKCVNINNSLFKHSSNNVFYTRIQGRLNCLDFFNIVYNNSNIHLIRKYNKFLKCLNSTNVIRNGNSWKKENRLNY